MTTDQTMIQVTLAKLIESIGQLGVMLETIADAQSLRVEADILRRVDEQRFAAFITHVNERLEAWSERIRPIAERAVDIDTL